MAYAAEAPDFANSVSVNAAEMENFAAMAADWWNPSGKFKPLHIMNACRTVFIKDAICTHFDRNPSDTKPLAGLRILDIGCGGGLLCEPMARLGATVTGLDALEKNVKAASTHAKKMGLEIDYIYGSIEAMVSENMVAPFDAVLNMEVIEHVNQPAEFLGECAQMVADNGLMFCSTISRTAKAFALAIFGAEYVMRWLPRGTHQYEKFIKPEELTTMLRRAGLRPDEPCGMTLNPLTQTWRISADTSVNYLVSAVRQ